MYWLLRYLEAISLANKQWGNTFIVGVDAFGHLIRISCSLYLIWMWYFHIWSKLRFFREIWRGWSNQDILQNQGAYLKQLFHKILPPLGIGPYLITQGWGEQILSYSDIRYSPQPPPHCSYALIRYENKKAGGIS